MSEETKTIGIVNGGECIFYKGEQIHQIALVVKGTVSASNSYIQYAIGSGNVLGILDISCGEYLFDYKAVEDCTIYYMSFNDYEDLSVLSKAVKEYKDLCASSAEYQIKEIISAYEALNKLSGRIIENIKRNYAEYKILCKDYMINPIINTDIDDLSIEESDENDEFLDKNYIKQLVKLPKEVHKNFFEADSEILKYHLKVEGSLCASLNSKCCQLFLDTMKNFELLYCTGTSNIFAMYSTLALNVGKAKGHISGMLDKMKEINNLIRNTKKVMEEVLGLEFSYDSVRIEDIFKAVESFNSKDKSEDIDSQMLMDYSRSAVEDAILESKDTLKRLVEYADYNREKAQLFEKYLTVYRNLKDKTSTEEDVRKLRKRIADIYYEIYELVFIKAEEENNHERYIDVFLNFGCIDEKMLSNSTIVDLYSDDVIGRIKDINDDENMEQICVFTIRQWLHNIYIGRRQPSKNEFDLDYFEDIRERKKTEKFSEADEARMINDNLAKVRFEISNMFKINNRLTNGQLLTFCPVLMEEDFLKPYREIRVRQMELKKLFDEIVDVDFSAFVREYMYENVQDKISKISIYKQVRPDVILMPNVGIKGTMWQEISGKKRDSRGRFALPIFTSEDIKNILIKIIGAFRWELCRTIQGTYWNDVRERSLTAEYCDYIQFYRKNKDLSDETKEKIKKQLAKCRNSSKEMFIKDYEVWISSESLGLARLNKISRMILFSYCPFSKEYRQKIAAQPMFTEGVAKFERERGKKLKEINNRYTAIKNANGIINDLLNKNLEYIKEQ